MLQIPFYIVDVFAANKYGGNQLAVFVDPNNQLSTAEMQQMATEINFAESAFIKEDLGNQRFAVRIFTPEHEVPFAGHPSLGAAYVISKFLLPSPAPELTLALAHSDIPIQILEPENVDNSLMFMQQAQPEFREGFTHEEISCELNIPLENLNQHLPVREISTGLPYIIIPLKNLKAMESLDFDYSTVRNFLHARFKYRTNSKTGHSTSLFFFTDETYEPQNQYNTRMRLLENGKLSEDAATGSANGCFLAYLLQQGDNAVNAIVEQGFQMNRKSYLYLKGERHEENYELRIGGKTQLVAEGIWKG